MLGKKEITEAKVYVAEMCMLRWMCEVTRKYEISIECMRGNQGWPYRREDLELC